MSRFTRRTFLEIGGAGAVASVAMPAAAGVPAEALSPGAAHASEVEAALGDDRAPRTAISLTVNGHTHAVEVEDRWTLAELLRDHLHLTGTKVACDRGECGACTVVLDGAAVYSCSTLAVWANGRAVETVEGLASGGQLHPLQQAFIEHDAPQCGFCTSGQLMSAKALLAVKPQPSPDDVRHALAGNLCRCSNYNHYVKAVVAAGVASSAATLPLADDGRASSGANSEDIDGRRTVKALR
jgi:xanthine dehydrogenase YagT iron-sulfur-binding subunit